ncbi:MAG: HYR domain-containing protein, partial [Crocinitomicaceae bacterium]
FPIGTTTNTFEVTDASGNKASCSFDIVITDNELPTITCIADILQNNDVGLCGANITYSLPIGFDNCPMTTINQTTGLASGMIFPIGTTTNTFEVTDPSGNTASCSFDVVITDAELPTITCIADITQNNDLGICGAVIAFAGPIIGTDNCPGSTTIQTAGLANGSVFPVGTTTNTFEVTDASGNVASCSFDVVITDNELPTIVCVADIARNNDIGVCGSTVVYNTPVGLDNCPNSIIVQTAGLASGSVFPIGTTTNTFEVTDASGNVANCSFDVVITDTELPTIVCVADIAQNNDIGVCGSTVVYNTPIGLDNCPNSITIQTAGLPSGSVFPIGTTTNTFEVTDASGNVASCSFDVVISDTELPTIVCIADIAQNNDIGVCGSTVVYNTPVGLDNCPNSITVQTAGLASGSVFPIGTTTNTFEVTDASGNAANCSFDVVITDAELPTIVCLTDIAQNNDLGVCGSTVVYNTPVGLDNCPNSVTIQTAGLASGSVFPIGTTTNTFEVTDASGNVASCSFDVVITDAELPTIVCVADIAQNNDLGVCGATITYVTPVGLDNCSNSVTIQTAGLASGSVFPIGTTTNTFEVTDASGNVASCSFDVVITDNELPTIVCVADIAQNNDIGVCGATITYTAPIGLDNCPNSITLQTAGLPSGSVFPIGTTTNTFEVTDASGNKASCSFDVVITDNELPTIVCADSFESCDSILTVNDPEIADNCANPFFELTSGLVSDTIFPVGVTTNVYTVTDASGNQATCSVEITRFQLPTIDAGADLKIDAGKNIDIDAVSTNADLFEWNPIEGLDDPTSENPNADPMYTTTYSILVTSPDGCVAKDSLNIKVNPVIEVNNFMSPNNDGKNDTWIIKGHYLLDNCVIQVYSGWGNLVYESNNGYDNKWDGTYKERDLPAGVYYYVISCGSDDTVKGSVTLVR